MSYLDPASFGMIAKYLRLLLFACLIFGNQELSEIFHNLDTEEMFA
jgi:hypothetical protein